MRVPRRAYVELRSKYVEMLAMRVEHERGTEDVREVRGRMGRLAATFPGALREIDELPLVEIRRRVRALTRVLGEGTAPAPWMIAMARFHALTRGALVAKRWLRGRKRVDDLVAARFVRDVAGLPFASDALAWRKELDVIASPPHGRLMGAVFRRLAKELNATESDARRMVFDTKRRPRVLKQVVT